MLLINSEINKENIPPKVLNATKVLKTFLIFSFLTVVEEQKAGAQKEVNDLRLNLREAEKARLDAHREAQELLRQAGYLITFILELFVTRRF